MNLVEVNDIFRFHSWDEVSEVIREMKDRCEKIEASVQEMPGVIPVNRLKEMILIKKRINQLNNQFEVVEKAVMFLKTIPKVGKEAEAVQKRFNELYKTFRDLRDRIEKDFLGQIEEER